MEISAIRSSFWVSRVVLLKSSWFKIKRKRRKLLTQGEENCNLFWQLKVSFMGNSNTLILALCEALRHSYYPSDRFQAPRMHLGSWGHYHGLAARTRKKPVCHHSCSGQQEAVRGIHPTSQRLQSKALWSSVGKDSKESRTGFLQDKAALTLLSTKTLKPIW